MNLSTVQRKWILTAALLLVAVLSMTVLTKTVTSAGFLQGLQTSLDQKKTDVLELMGASTAASVTVSAIPGDMATPIAEKLADLGNAFLFILCAIYLEKYLVSIAGYVAFRILIPAALILIVLWLHLGKRPLLGLAGRLLSLGLVIFLMVPVSVIIADRVELSYQASVDSALETAREVSGTSGESEKSGSDPAGDLEDVPSPEPSDSEASGTGASDAVTSSAVSNGVEEKKEGGSNSLLDRIRELAGSAKDAASDAISGITELPAQTVAQLQEMLKNFMEAIAAMIIISCVIPLLVLAFFLWVIRLIFGSMRVLLPGGEKKDKSFL